MWQSSTYLFMILRVSLGMRPRDSNIPQRSPCEVTPWDRSIISQVRTGWNTCECLAHTRPTELSLNETAVDSISCHGSRFLALERNRGDATCLRHCNKPEA